ncbi:hypothetical protein HK101_010985 [Irineochytrium annulatum]|nr:hypothetical protein HK101_010985 [Irineochytrium annulatum]
MPSSTLPLPGVHAVSLPEQKTFHGDDVPNGGSRTFPLALSPLSPTVLSPNLPANESAPTFSNAAAAATWARDNAAALREQLHSAGAILFRGFPLESAEHFSDFVEALGVLPLPYVGGAAPRNTVFKDVHTTNESPPDQPIPFHHEMAQVPKYPKTIFFFCDGEPKEGGETPLCPSDIAVSRLFKSRPSFATSVEQQGVIYTRVIPEIDDPSSPIGRGWVSTFQTSDRAKAVEVARDLNVSLEWLESGDVKTVSPVLAAIKTHPITGRKTWFNSVVAAYLGWRDSRNDPTKAVTLGDGKVIDAQDIEAMRGIMDECAVSVPWRKGDVVWIDNEQVLHSRRPFVAPRRILAYLGRN